MRSSSACSASGRTCGHLRRWGIGASCKTSSASWRTPIHIPPR
ncbi:MAG: hypothetical protein HZA46_00280 [Planctomycetales bacterium]|nr:hypothetical protein [Planctomycetales bacterium]